MTKEEAIKHFGGAPALAEALGVFRQAVYQWDEIPAGRQFQIELLTGGALKADPAPPKDPKPTTNAA